ncbi:MAG: HslU--HslV peptidase proteolytic subunit [Candidatus Cloacimonetes bacterium 4572_55]|nr:MAG: HslU--HslV peptidase proteolytic subunit [Candidatus Cloacimonetes bacterium 4572_55]
MRDVRSTTIIGVRHKGDVVIAGDGQVTFDHLIMKHSAKKIRTMLHGKALAGFAGSAADALTLFEIFEAKLEEYKGNLPRAAVELAKKWRSDKYLRHLDALIIVMDKTDSYLISGTGDVIQPEDGIIAIGSGGAYATAAARALVKYSTLTAKEIAEEAMGIAASLCIYTNNQITLYQL